jgi:hypothetical protein
VAMSNWDVFAVDGAGQATTGGIRSPLGVEVRIYKNWLYVDDEHGWQEGMFRRPCVMEIQHGSVSYKDVRITAIRGPKSGIYCVVETYAKGHDGDCMVGIGAYGYDWDMWVGIEAAEVEFLRTWLHHSYDEVVVTDAGDRVFTSWDFDERIRAIDLAGGLRVNQGDLYIAQRLDGMAPQATAPGDALSPILETIVDEVAKSKQ